MSSPTVPVKSTQIVAGVAVVLALLGGAYAVGRSQGGAVEAVAEPPPAVTSAAEERREAPAKPQRLAAAEAPRSARTAPVEAPRPVALCQSCARVVNVHSESRRGEGSGVGAVGGAVVGGLLGNMIGGGNGRKLATVGGAVAGGYAGNEIEKNQKSRSIWVVQVEDRDGRTHRFERSADPGLRVGDEVLFTENGFERR